MEGGKAVLAVPLACVFRVAVGQSGLAKHGMLEAKLGLVLGRLRSPWWFERCRRWQHLGHDIAERQQAVAGLIIGVLESSHRHPPHRCAGSRYGTPSCSNTSRSDCGTICSPVLAFSSTP